MRTIFSIVEFIRPSRGLINNILTAFDAIKRNKLRSILTSLGIVFGVASVISMLAIGRGLASSPKLLMLDEPSMGLAPAIADFIFETLIEIRKQTKLTILLVEQRVAEALESADHGYVLEAGRVVLEGNNATLRADDRVREAYLGM